MANPRSYRPISLLCVLYKLLERLLLFLLEPVIDPQLPTQQGGFRRGRYTVQQVAKLTSDIEDNCEEDEERVLFSWILLRPMTLSGIRAWH